MVVPKRNRSALVRVFFVLAILASAFSLTSCAVTSVGSTTARPSIAVSPSLVSFGSVKIKTQTTQTLTVSNTGKAPLTISQAAVSGTGFSLSGISAPITVAAGASMNFTVSFQPTTTGAASGSIAISSNASTSPLTISLAGTGVTASTPAISVTPAALNFGSLTVKTSASQTVKLSNPGTADLTISQAGVSGTGFSLSGLTAPMTVAAGASMNFTVSFQPAATGAASGSISITSNAGSSPAVISLTGTGVATSTPAISVTPAALNFGNLTVKTSASQTVTLSNTGTATLSISQASITGTGFGMSGLTAPKTVAAGASMNFTVSFQPTATGATSGSISITSNAGSSPAVISLTGTGVATSTPAISVTPGALNFGNLTVKTLASHTVTLSNTGTAALTISQASVSGTGFSLSGLTAPVTVAAGASMNFTVSFQPTATGAASGSISINHNAGSSPAVISLTGTGVATSTPAISVTPGALNFGSLTVKTSASHTVTLSNTGTATLSISQANITGSGFGMSGLVAPATVAAGASVNFTVSFQPTSTGAVSGSISITSNANPSPLTIGLTGTGVAASSPAISVTPASVGFGNLTVKTSATQTVKLSNTGTADLTISQANITGTGFGMSGLTVPMTVAAGASMNFTVSFQPTTTGAASGSIAIMSNAGNSPLSIPMTGTGVAAILTLSASPASIAFGNVTVGTTATQNDQLTNTGNAQVDIATVSVTGAGFSVTGGSNTILAPNQSVAVTVRFNPQAAGSASGNLAVLSNAPALSISLSGTGTAPVQHSVSLAWDPSPSTNVVTYVVYRRTGTTGSFVKVGSTSDTVTTFTDSTVQGNQTYFYEVTCIDSNNLESNVDGPVSATTPGP